MKAFDKEFITYQIEFGYKKVEEFDLTDRQIEKLIDVMNDRLKWYMFITKDMTNTMYTEAYKDQINNLKHACQFLQS